MHAVTELIRSVNKTHHGLGAMVALNIISAKARRCMLNIAPAGCGKSSATDAVTNLLEGRCEKYTSLTLAGLVRLRELLTNYHGHLVIDDLGAEKSEWSRTSTITVLATLVHTHTIRKITHTSEITITNFQGSAALNIQPVLMDALVKTDDWIAVVRDKVLRNYHLIRPIKPQAYMPKPKFNWGANLEEIAPPKRGTRLWYQLIAIGLTQWSYARCIEHLPVLLKASAALDGRLHCQADDYKLLIKLLLPMQLERYIVGSFGFESGRSFATDTYCLLVELASHKEPTIETICEDYKVSPATVERVIAANPEWCWVKTGSNRTVQPSDAAKKILDLVGVHQKW